MQVFEESIIFENKEELLNFLYKTVKNYNWEYYKHQISRLNKEILKEQDPNKIRNINKQIERLQKTADGIKPFIINLNTLIMELERLCNVVNEPRESSGIVFPLDLQNGVGVKNVTHDIISCLDYFAGDNNISKQIRKDDISRMKEIKSVSKKIEIIIEKLSSLIKFNDKIRYGYYTDDNNYEYLRNQDLSCLNSLKITIKEILDSGLEKKLPEQKSAKPIYDENHNKISHIIKLNNGSETEVIFNVSSNYNNKQFREKFLQTAIESLPFAVKRNYNELEFLKEKYDIIYNEKNESRYFKRIQQINQVMNCYENAAIHQLMVSYSKIAIENLDADVYKASIAELEKNIIKETKKYEKTFEIAESQFKKLIITNVEKDEIEKFANQIQGKDFEKRKADVLIDHFQENPTKVNRDRIAGLDYFKHHVQDSFEKNDNSPVQSIVDENIEASKNIANEESLNSQNFKPIEIPQYLKETRTVFYQEYIFFRMSNPDSKCKFSSFLQQNHPDEIELIKIEQEKEKQANTVYKEYIIYKASQEDKNNCISFKDYVNSKYMEFNIDIDSVDLENESKRI